MTLTFMWASMLLSCCFAVCSSDQYSQYRAYEVIPRTKDQLIALQDLEDDLGVDFWSPLSLDNSATLMIAPNSFSWVHGILKDLGVYHRLVTKNVAKFLRKEQNNVVAPSTRRSSSQPAYLTRYLRYGQMITLLQELQKEYPQNTRLEEIGLSFEGRRMYMIRLSSDFADVSKPIVMYEAGMHAREWAAPALAIAMINHILQNQTMLNDQDFHFIVSANPDGYEFTHTGDRLWRKTRSKIANSTCLGTDGNRNFNIHWAEIGSSNDPCTEIYHGSRPFSEPETRNVRDAAKRYRKRIRNYIALHSFGNYLLYPYGHAKTPEARTHKDLKRCVLETANVISKEGGPEFTVGNTASIFYPSGAGSDDYMLGKLGIPYAYTVELPGGGKSGFDLPPQEIKEMVRYMIPGMMALSTCWSPKYVHPVKKTPLSRSR